MPARDARRAGDGEAPPPPPTAAGTGVRSVEAPRGQYSTYVISDGTDQPFRMRIHDASFLHLEILGLLMPGTLVADIMVVMSSLDPVMGGVDK